MKYLHTTARNTRIDIASFEPAQPGSPREVHAVLHLSPEAGAAAIDELSAAIAGLPASVGADAVMQFARFMVADEALGRLIAASSLCAGAARSVVVQPPLDGAAASVWIVWLSGVESSPIGKNLLETDFMQYRIIWEGDRAIAPAGNSLDETRAALGSLEYTLRQNHGSLADSCHRTWFIVRDIDNNYGGVVEGRNEVFSRLGLTRDSHFIASTGIGGAPAGPHRAIAFNSYSVLGLAPDSVRYLKAADHMNNTMDYGVAFERGTALDFPDRRQVLISGTASIDTSGQIVHEGDVERQTGRMIQNVDALIQESGTSRADLCYILVYLRNPADASRVAPIIRREFGGVPAAIVHAPVCRKGWLVEMECALLARTDINNNANS
ncbi:MAG: hypothetical protein K2M12_04705 [Muribaculaceae bacterium]|nr:hypothetical protein [Muribaculaceae bacterium]